jgi:hypothetical protein
LERNPFCRLLRSKRFNPEFPILISEIPTVAKVCPSEVTRWRDMIAGPILLHEVPGDRLNVPLEPIVKILARQLAFSYPQNE